jgi:superfamily II DNA or RNA helicase
LLIVDEAHIQLTDRKVEIFNKYPMTIGFTATPIGPNGKGMGSYYDSLIATISMQELIDQKYLTPLKYFVKPVDVDLKSVPIDSTGDYIDYRAALIMNKPKLVGDVFFNWLNITGGTKPTVVFASSQDHAKALCLEFNNHGFPFAYLDCHSNDDYREEVFEKIKTGELLGICNVGIVGIGVDIECLEVCVMACPTRLITKFFQCIGRVTRLFDGKEFGIVIDHAGIIEYFIRKFGLPTYFKDWTLDDKKSVEEMAEQIAQEEQHQKEIICPECGLVFSGSLVCPRCGHRIADEGKPLPTYRIELKELDSKKPVIDKNLFYCELLGYCDLKNKESGYAKYIYKERFNELPKNGSPIDPSIETINYIKHINIRNFHRGKKK